jgi:hypothetical protein
LHSFSTRILAAHFNYSLHVASLFISDILIPLLQLASLLLGILFHFRFECRICKCILRFVLRPSAIEKNFKTLLNSHFYPLDSLDLS